MSPVSPPAVPAPVLDGVAAVTWGVVADRHPILIGHWCQVLLQRCDRGLYLARKVMMPRTGS